MSILDVQVYWNGVGAVSSYSATSDLIHNRGRYSSGDTTQMTTQEQFTRWAVGSAESYLGGHDIVYVNGIIFRPEAMPPPTEPELPEPLIEPPIEPLIEGKIDPKIIIIGVVVLILLLRR